MMKRKRYSLSGGSSVMAKPKIPQYKHQNKLENVSSKKLLYIIVSGCLFIAVYVTFLQALAI